MVFCNYFWEILVIFAFLVTRLKILIILISMIIFAILIIFTRSTIFWLYFIKSARLMLFVRLYQMWGCEIIWKANVFIVLSILFFDIHTIFARSILFGRSYKMWRWWYLRGWNYLESQWAGTTGAEVSAHRGLQGVPKISDLQNSLETAFIHSACCQKTSKHK